MSERDFAYWLQGYFEINASASGITEPLSATQVQVIKNHLNLVFAHSIDPQALPPGMSAQQAQAIHDGEPAFNHSVHQSGLTARC